MNDPVLFYKVNDAHGCFSNFSRHPITLMDRTWATSEHYFQAQKFTDHRPDLVDMVAAAATPKEAAAIGRDPANPVRPDWDALPRPNPIVMMLADLAHGIASSELERHAAPEPLFSRVKDLVMFEAVLNKFRTNEDIGKVLTETGTRPIVEASDVDGYWGWGPDHRGANKLGRMLMLVREALSFDPRKDGLR